MSEMEKQQPPPAYTPGAQPGYPPPQGGAYPPPQGAYPPAQQPATVVVGVQGLSPAMLSDSPVQMTCPSCGAQIVTRVEYENGTLVWLIFVLLLIFFICASCVPFCIDDLKDVHHYCPNCNNCVGIKKRM